MAIRPNFGKFGYADHHPTAGVFFAHLALTASAAYIVAMRHLLLIPVVVLSIFAARQATAEIPPIPRVLPPEGLEIPAEVRERLETRLAATKKRMEAHKEHDLLPDIEIFTKAVEFALLHREFYVPKDFAKADWALDEANKRLDSLDKCESPWTKATGLVVRGYRSSIDNSAQPYGLVIPKDHDFEKPCPLYVWLHGRGDKNTDLHFLQERATKPGQITPPGAIVVHPFGRQCVGWKHAGEIDVLEVAGWVAGEYGLDQNRIVLIGFSMGGAGAWHIGAHYADKWVAVSPGAGFAETARYQNLKPERYPPAYEQKLWGVYDVPGYVRKLFNTNVIAYSGENDKQIQAARVMEEAFRREGRELTHLIGPGVEHKYEPKTLEELMRRLGEIAAKGRDETPSKIHVQTQTARYGAQGWVDVCLLEEHWKDTRVDAEIVRPKHVTVTTKNVAALELSPFRDMKGTTINIDGAELVADPPKDLPWMQILVKKDGKWHLGSAASLDPKVLSKTSWQQGPIDDAFMHRFLVVVPSGKSKNAAFQQWMDFELAHFRDRWRALMRAQLPVKNDVAVTDNDLNDSLNLILWGDPDSNVHLARLLKDTPVGFEGGKWQFGGHSWDGNQFVPAAIYPRKNSKGEYQSYLVLNSGLTFREGHDKTNSQQNPKLPDWAIIDITQPPDAFAPGRIHDAGFFDEEWRLKGPVKGP